MRFVFCVVALIVSAMFSADLAAFTIQASQHTDSHSTSTLLYWLLGSGVAALGATLSTNTLTLADHAKRLDPSGKIAAIVEMLE